MSVVKFAIVAVLTVSTVVVGACSEPTEDTVTPRDPCRAIVDDAAIAAERREQIALLDNALVVCRSVDALDRALSAHPGAVDVDGVTFATRRCTDPPDARVERSTICTDVAPPTTTEPPPEDPRIGVYVGVTLDGREVEILASDTLFTQGRPASIVQIVDIGTEDGCPGVEEEYRRWLGLVLDPEWGDEASVYAQHALNVLATLECPVPE